MAEIIDAVLSEPRPTKTAIAALDAFAEKAYQAYSDSQADVATAVEAYNAAVAAVSGAEGVMDTARLRAEDARSSSTAATRAAFAAKQEPRFRVTVVDRGRFVPVGPDIRDLDAEDAQRMATKLRDGSLVQESNGGYEVIVRKEV